MDPESVEIYLKGAYDLQELKLFGVDPRPEGLLYPDLKTEEKVG